MKNYEMITLNDYIENLENAKCTTVAQKDIEEKVEKYLLNVQRAKTNAKVIEALLA